MYSFIAFLKLNDLLNFRNLILCKVLLENVFIPTKNSNSKLNWILAFKTAFIRRHPPPDKNIKQLYDQQENKFGFYVHKV